MSGLGMGTFDPALKLSDQEFLVALRTPDGPVTVQARQGTSSVDVQCWGSGASWLGAGKLEPLLGFDDTPNRFQPTDRVVGALWRPCIGMHLPRLPRIFDRVVQVVLLQLVTWRDGVRAWKRLVNDFGETAPGPHGLRLPPSAETIAAIPSYSFHEVGVLRRQAETIRRAARCAHRIEEAAERGAEALESTLGAVRGIGPWTTQYVLGSGLAAPDAVLTGDCNLPHAVCWALAREEFGTDERMLDLLEPYRGDRFRVIRAIWLNGVRAPRRSPPRAGRPRTA